MSTPSVQFVITATAQKHIKLAIKWKAKTVDEKRAQALITEALTNFKHQLVTLPNSGKKCLYLDMDQFREMTKGDYRLIYQIDQTDKHLIITLVLFSHVRMDYQTLLNQLPEFY